MYTFVMRVILSAGRFSLLTNSLTSYPGAQFDTACFDSSFMNIQYHLSASIIPRFMDLKLEKFVTFTYLYGLWTNFQPVP